MLDNGQPSMEMVSFGKCVDVQFPLDRYMQGRTLNLTAGLFSTTVSHQIFKVSFRQRAWDQVGLDRRLQSNVWAILRLHSPKIFHDG